MLLMHLILEIKTIGLEWAPSLMMINTPGYLVIMYHLQTQDGTSKQ